MEEKQNRTKRHRFSVTIQLCILPKKSVTKVVAHVLSSRGWKENVSHWVMTSSKSPPFHSNKTKRYWFLKQFIRYINIHSFYLRIQSPFTFNSVFCCQLQCRTLSPRLGRNNKKCNKTKNSCSWKKLSCVALSTLAVK